MTEVSQKTNVAGGGGGDGSGAGNGVVGGNDGFGVKSGITTGEANSYESLQEALAIPPKDLVYGSPVKLFWNDLPLATYAWTTWIRERWIELKQLDEFHFTVLIHYVVDTPVAAAQDHPEFADLSFVWRMVTASDAFICNFTNTHRRGCGKYLYEVRDMLVTSQVAYPVTNAAKVYWGGSFATRVTAC